MVDQKGQTVVNLPFPASVLYAAAIEAGDLLRAASNAHLAEDIKDARDVRTVTSRADIEAEHVILERLHRELDVRALSEEMGGEHEPSEYLAIVDPLDGSMNYLRDSWGLCAVSISIVKGEEIVAGIIHLPFFSETLVAQKGAGAFYERAMVWQPMGPPAVPHYSHDLEGARIVVARGTLPSLALTHPPLSTLIASCAEPVNYASCCVGLASIALGRIDGLVIPQQIRWDFTAGYCILKEMGLPVEARRADEATIATAPDPLAKFDVVAATNFDLFEKIQSILGAA